jgi:hypothetical protein
VLRTSAHPRNSFANGPACFGLSLLTLIILCFSPVPSSGQARDVFVEGPLRAMIATNATGNLRSYELSTNAELRGNRPPDKRITFSETPNHARVRTSNLFFDGLYALAISDSNNVMMQSFV